MNPGSKLFDWGWLPPDINPAYGLKIDHLYYVIMAVILVMFFLTQGLLVYSLIRYRRREGRKAVYTHGNRVVEAVWTVVPALILLFLIFYQQGVWTFITAGFPAEKDSLVVQVLAEQFAWNFRYAGAKGHFGGPGNVMVINNLRVPVNQKVLLKMTSKDVIHSLFIPYARVKQDVVPGMLVRAWFAADRIACWDLKKQALVLFTEEEIRDKKVALDGFDLDYKKADISGKRDYFYSPSPGTGKCRLLFRDRVTKEAPEKADYVLHYFDLACSQLCGLGHFRMRGRLIVQPRAVFEAWLADSEKHKVREAEGKWTGIWDKLYPAAYNQ